MFEEVKKMLVDEMSIDASEITENAEFVKDLGITDERENKAQER